MWSFFESIDENEPLKQQGSSYEFQSMGTITTYNVLPIWGSAVSFIKGIIILRVLGIRCTCSDLLTGSARTYLISKQDFKMSLQLLLSVVTDDKK